jgi:hypothetical protein
MISTRTRHRGLHGLPTCATCGPSCAGPARFTLIIGFNDADGVNRTLHAPVDRGIHNRVMALMDKGRFNSTASLTLAGSLTPNGPLAFHDLLGCAITNVIVPPDLHGK